MRYRFLKFLRGAIFQTGLYSIIVPIMDVGLNLLHRLFRRYQLFIMPQSREAIPLGLQHPVPVLHHGVIPTTERHFISWFQLYRQDGLNSIHWHKGNLQSDASKKPVASRSVLRVFPFLGCRIIRSTDRIDEYQSRLKRPITSNSALCVPLTKI